MRAWQRRLIDNVQNGPSIRRIRAAIANAKALNADGVILFCHWGCKQTMGMALLARQMLSDAGSADARSGWGRLRQPQRRGRSDGVTRVGAFLEQLEGLSS